MPKASAPATADLWTAEPEDKDFPAALDYLSLVMLPEVAERLVEDLRKAGTVHRKAKDLLRASRLALLPEDNVHVRSDLRKIKRKIPLSPVLLVRGDSLNGDRPLEVADGYHRVCASYWTDENFDIPCRLVSP
jgi:hypothetical protein